MLEDKEIEKIDSAFNSLVKSRPVHECTLYIEDGSGDFSYKNSYGGKELDSPFFIASITKLFTTACILKLYEEGKLSLNYKISNYVRDDILKGLHIYKDKEYSYEITIRDLLFQVSGLADIFRESKEGSIKKSDDYKNYINFDEKIRRLKGLTPHFPPRRGNSAHYSDMNFDLLGIILENISGLSIDNVFNEYIIDPLDLESTYLPIKGGKTPGIYFKDEFIKSPNLLMSNPASGGLVSTPKDIMKFLKAFFNGNLFDKELFKTLSDYKKLQAAFGPIYYGGGYMQIPLETGQLLGHSGITGSFAFYKPETDIFIVGSIYQLADQVLPIRFLTKISSILM